MKKKYELLGYKMEISGLLFALLAAYWQATFSGWWDIERVEWQYIIQEEVNLSMLSALGKVSSLQAIDESAKRKQQAFEIDQNIGKAMSRAIDMRQQRKIRLDEQAELFSDIGFSLMFISACLIIAGKILVYKSAKGPN
ncbi:hypothetical protein ACJ5N2_09410 [Aeromonas salmonicida]|uniref:hypothetical protein n=1 Tax=Aeromonas salmonicida TaxID=645 RepID=UPI0038BB5EAE